jgi:hypothetical protein
MTVVKVYGRTRVAGWHEVGLKDRYCCDIPLFKGSVASLPLICTEGGAPGYKSVGRSRIHDSITIIRIINTINSNFMFMCSACLNLTGMYGRPVAMMSELWVF